MQFSISQASTAVALAIACCGIPTTASEPSVTDVPLKRIEAISQQIDALVEAKLVENGERPNDRTSDDVFLRRAYLDIVGRIPTLDETRNFLDAKKQDRSKLIDQLLDSPGHVSHQFNWWADILRIKSRMNGGNPGQPYIDFVKESLRNNRPYDDFVHELIASEGPALERGNGETGYYLRDTGMPEDNMANTVRIFLGTRMECAQCHDHPFDKWTQREFFEMVAFTGGMRTRMNAGDGMAASNGLRRKLQKADVDAQVKQLAINMTRPLSYGVVGGGTGLARLPDSYQYDDGEPNEIVMAKTMFEKQELVHPEIPAARGNKKRKRNKRYGEQIRGAKDIGSRKAFADWLSSPDNPRFTTMIANRLWKRTMGLGLIEPIDDITDATVASNSELMTFLSQQMIDLDYDMRQFMRAIYNSKTYQREACKVDIADAATYYFPGPTLRRMTGEQLWDSFLTLAVPDLDQRQNPRKNFGRNLFGAEDIYDGYEKAKELSVDEILELAQSQLEMRNDPAKRRKKYREMMMSSEAANPYAEEAEQVKQQIAQLKQLQKRANKNRNRKASRALQVKVTKLSQLLRSLPTRVGGDMVRASELSSPAPAGHFLREFGQSDREQIENANTEPAVNQVLALMNGTIEKRIISNPRTVLMRNIVVAPTVNDKVDVVFLSMLNRYPDRSEKRIWLEAAKTGGAEAAHDLIWTLANTSEFMFVQ